MNHISSKLKKNRLIENMVLKNIALQIMDSETMTIHKPMYIEILWAYSTQLRWRLRETNSKRKNRGIKSKRWTFKALDRPNQDNH